MVSYAGIILMHEISMTPSVEYEKLIFCRLDQTRTKKCTNLFMFHVHNVIVRVSRLKSHPKN